MMDNDNADILAWLDDLDDEYDEDLSLWNANDWIASHIETLSPIDTDYIRLTSLSPENLSQIEGNLFPGSSSSKLFTSDSSTLVYSLIDLTENCISPSLSQLISQLLWIVVFCSVFRLLYLSRCLTSRQLHLLQISASILILAYYFHFQSIYLLTYVIMGYGAFRVCLNKCRPYLRYIIACFSIIYVLACEFLLIDAEKWHMIRGVQMCLMMKMISLAFDYPFFEYRSKTNTSESILIPTALEFFSYILSIHNTIFGPWINYRNYIRYFAEDYPRQKIDFFELVKWIYYFIRLAFCLIVSTCLADWFLRSFQMDLDDIESHGWRTAYIQALSYRFSHYCVCFIGEFCGLISGLEFQIDEYRSYSIICQQAQERIEMEKKTRQHFENEFHSSSFSSDGTKRKQRMKKSSHHQQHDGNLMKSPDESNDSNYSSWNSDNVSHSTMESDSTTVDSILHRRTMKKSAMLSNGSTKRKGLSTRSTTNHHQSSSIVKPSHIELPHSLVDVVVNWNLPMHYWLKIYVYIPMKQKYGHFASVLVTYLASALLHGFNFQLSIVLFSIGLFAYVEYGFRRKLARILDACVAARACPHRSSCDEHRYSYWHPLTIIVNLFLCLLSLWHLTYLGQLFDGSSQETIGYSWQHVLDKWAKLNFASHLVVIGTYVIFRSL